VKAKYHFSSSTIFKSAFKKLLKRNRHLREDFKLFLKAFDHTRGDFIPKTRGARTIRMRVTGMGKRKGYRIIYYFIRENTVHFLAIYSKAIKEDLSAAECKRIRELVGQLKGER